MNKSKKQEKKITGHVRFSDSIRAKMMFFVFIMVSGTFLLYLLMNSLFLERYYQKHKEEMLLVGYEKMQSLIEKENAGSNDLYGFQLSENTQKAISNICEKAGIAIIIIGQDNVAVYQYGNGKELIRRLNAIDFGITGGSVHIIKRTDNYILQEYIEGQNSADYLELFGTFDGKRIFLMRMMVESIQESASISQRFFFFTGMGVLIVGLIVGYFVSRRFVRPITKLSDLSLRMSDLDFNAKYDGNLHDEIGILGQSMNIMSDRLEKTIVDLKNANNQLMRDLEQKEQIDEMRKDFISNVSHELKTPIALIQGYAEGLVECINDDAESREFYCDVIMDEADKMGKLVKSLLMLNQLEFGSKPAQFERIDVALMIRDIVQSFDVVLKQENISVIYDMEEDTYGLGDEFQIEGVITNYITNAMHYVEGDKIIRINVRRMNEKIRVSVFNTGTPIPEEELDKIWIKFYKVDKARTREYGGSGIGLSIVKAVMKQHGQECGVLNHEDGVEFWFELDTIA